MSKAAQLHAPGTVVADRYRIDTMIGRGGMGTVYAAEQIALGRKVALKVISPNHAGSANARRRFEREARVTSTLRHDNAVEIYDFGEFDSTLFLAMEFLDGPTLRSLVDLDKPPLHLKHACRIAATIADVLAAASAIGLIHRDLKPENVILDRSRGVERVVVVDFGLAFIQDGELSGRLTREGTVTGTPDYMAPEQARGLEVTPATDVYGLGCLLHEMLTAEVPFDGEPALVMSRHLFVAPRPIREAFPDLRIPGALDELVMRMLSKSPEERPGAESVRDVLRRVDPARPQRSNLDDQDQPIGRAARMISIPPAGLVDRDSRPSSDLEQQACVALDGKISDEFSLALGANGLRSITLEDDWEALPSGVNALYAAGATPQRVADLQKHGVPVVTDAFDADAQRLADLLRAGAAEVVIQPCAPADVARKILRAIRKA